MSDQSDLDFEVCFYEKLVKDNPCFVNALTVLGDVYTKKGRYKDGLKIDRKLVKLTPQDPIVYYNLACSYSLLKMADSCLKALRKALKLGCRDFSFIQKDPDLAFIRQDPRYNRLLSKYRDKHHLKAFPI